MKKTLFNRCRAVIDAGYKPENFHYTSKEEIEYISKLMGFDELSSWDLQNLRDMWVALHTNIDTRNNIDNDEIKEYFLKSILDQKNYSKKTFENYKLTIEVKSVNNRYLDYNVKLYR